MAESHRFGFVTILGRPNVGKSTLINQFIGKKISIISSKPQTTRHRILGIRTSEQAQTVFIDTPGVHQNQKSYLNKIINRTASSSLEGVDLVLFMVTADGWREADETAFQLVKRDDLKVIVVINKIDRLDDKNKLLPLIERISQSGEIEAVIPISALRRKGVKELMGYIERHLPEGLPGFPKDQVTDRSPEFMAAELVREQLFRRLGQELPYVCAVEIESFAKEKHRLNIHAVIWVEKPGHKAIVLGKNGSSIREIGKKAREGMIKMYNSPVYLGLFVKVREGWSENPRVMKTLGYID
ncbi:MAG: GTPase Era [Arenicellales bacterium]|jgi:GTP-binding protein Era|nr:GTPase Era [Acidiferrobacteraceae bacterium]MDP6123137.1 GTPase Era [Arenicellales bacterium]MBT58586.1 GTPase Era [Acidiferrobacteraceae bacterium]MDP6288992.1 GTPase Era [Arenicellales bacterium]MDP6435542.1 GTPase Era [Arenicellales bacterium]|tara:strand:+ start:2638 stop:3531 length:894 start_codon:yes stop_codon:yes gene_type:complete